jgi:flavodoxin
MQKLTMILVALLTMSLSVYSQSTNSKGNTKMEKTLVAYFSASGTTEKVAKSLAKVAEADLHEIKPAQKYSDADLNWHDKQSRSSVEMADKSSRPAITDKLSNMGDYQTIFVGFPIWWYTCPTIINTFFESYDFSGKTVFLFATSGGSTVDKALKDLKASYPNINIKNGKLLNYASEKELKAFCGK